MRRYSYLTKMIVFGCLMCTLPVLFIGVISYIKSSAEIQKQVDRGQMQLLKQMNANVEQTLQTMNHAFNQLVSGAVVSKALTEPFSSEDFQAYRDLRREISNTQSSFTKVEDIVIVNMKQNWMIKNSGFYAFDQYLHHTLIANQLYLPSSTSWVLNPSLWFYSEEKANVVDCPYTISLVKKLPNQSLDTYGLAYANIPTCRLAEIINYTPQASEMTMIVDEQDRIIYHNNPDMIGMYVRDTGIVVHASELMKHPAQFRTEIEKQPYSVTYLRSPFNGWTYLSAVSIDSLTLEAKKIRQYTIYVSLLILAVFLLAAWFGSRRMYSPIANLLRQTGGKAPRPEAGETRMTEFDIIRDRLENLSKSKTQLEHEVHRHLQQARTFFLIKMYQGTIRRKDLLERMELFGYTRRLEEWRHMAVFTLQIDTLENTRYGKDDLELLLFAINNIIEEIIPEDVRLTPVFIDQTQVTLLGTREDDPESFHSYLYAVTESIQQTVERVLFLKISIGISLPFDDIKHSGVAYREGLEALKHRIHLGEGVIIRYANINAGRHQTYLDYPFLTENELADAIVLADQEKAEALLQHFMTTIFKHELTPQEYQVPMVRLLNRLITVLQESGLSLTQLQAGGPSLFEQLNGLAVTSEIEDWFRTRVVGPLIELFRERQSSQYQNISEKIISMIHQHYDTDLTMEKCAAELHYNANYLSGVFRKETGQTFSDYLATYRLSMAKKWLATTDMTIKDISERLQYLNSQNFIRSFRRQEGLTPGQYRESCRKSG